MTIIDHSVIWTDPNGQPATIEPLKGDPRQLIEHLGDDPIAPNTIEPDWSNDRLDFAFVISVLTDHHQRTRPAPQERPRGDARHIARSGFG